MACYIEESRDAKTTVAAVEAGGRKCIAISGDVRDSAFCEKAVKDTLARFGNIDVLVNNAAFQVHAAQIEDLTEEHFDMTLRTNLYVYFHMAKACIAQMKPGSAIVNTGSVTGLLGVGAVLQPHYWRNPADHRRLLRRLGLIRKPDQAQQLTISKASERVRSLPG